MLRTALLLCLLLCANLAQAADGKPDRAAVASAHPAATVAGLETLAQGGNAFDAAVAIAAALAVAEPYGSGLGGGGFFLLRQAGEKPIYRFLDARERAPVSAGRDLYRRNGQVQRELSLNGPLAAAIPGLPAALALLAERYGQLPLAYSLTPAMRLARDGVGIDPVYRERAEWRLEAMQKDGETARIFLDHGRLPPLHGLLHQPELERTLQRLADSGHIGFYGGETARRLLEGVRAAGGIWSERDLREYQVVERQPLRFPLADGRELISAPPPSAGGVAIAQSLAMLQQLPWQKAGDVQRSHYVTEVLRRAYRDRGLLGDPDHIRNPLVQLLDNNYLHGLAKGIQLQAATPSSSLTPTPPWSEGDHTTHFTVIDTQGNAVAATLSINLPFGAAFTVPGTGVLLNNEMDDFAADPSGSNVYGLTGSQANAIAGGKRPLSSMSPTFIESETELASFGTPGGSRIPSMVLLAILDYLDGKPVAQWPATPRYHHQYLPDTIEYEPGAFSASQRAGLEMRGHKLTPVSRRYGNQQVLLWRKQQGEVQAASDPRGIGQAAFWPAENAEAGR